MSTTNVDFDPEHPERGLDFTIHGKHCDSWADHPEETPETILHKLDSNDYPEYQWAARSVMGYPKVDLLPTKDGITHINIYTKSATQLGRDLSNLSRLPVTIHGVGQFQSLEGYWYWLKTGKKHDFLKGLWGTQAKFKGSELDVVYNASFEREFAAAIELRLEQHPSLAEAVRNCKLPFTHYYWFGKDPQKPKVVDVANKHQWQIDVYERIRRFPTNSTFSHAEVIIVGDSEVSKDILVTIIEQQLGGTVVSKFSNTTPYQVVLFGLNHTETEFKQWDTGATLAFEGKFDDSVDGCRWFCHRVEEAKVWLAQQARWKKEFIEEFKPLPQDAARPMAGLSVVLRGKFSIPVEAMRTQLESLGATVLNKRQSPDDMVVLGALSSDEEYEALQSVNAVVIMETEQQ